MPIKSKKHYPTGLIITEDLKRTMAEDKQDGKKLHIMASLPTKIDWRDNSGNFLTPIQNQADCGSCVAFGTTAVLEGMMRIQQKNPAADVKLSEWDLFEHGGSCGGGWTLEGANRAALNGICSEKCWPYNGTKQTCSATKIVKTTASTRITSDASAKQWLATNGPIQAAMDVFEDFFNYDSGVYSQEYGGYIGGHCIAIVGYDEALGCWIAKNSWSTQWGVDGWFRIKYGECGIFRAYAAYGLTIAGSAPPEPPVPPVVTKDVIIKKLGAYKLQLVSNFRSKIDVKSVYINSISHPIAEFPKYKYVPIGTYKPNDILKFELETATGTLHLDAKPFGYNYWYLTAPKITFMLRM